MITQSEFRRKVIVGWIALQISIFGVASYWGLYRIHQLMERQMVEGIQRHLTRIATLVSRGELPLQNVVTAAGIHPRVIRARIEKLPDTSRMSGGTPPGSNGVNIRVIQEGTGVFHDFSHVYEGSVPLNGGAEKFVAIYETSDVNSAFARSSKALIETLGILLVLSTLCAGWVYRALERKVEERTKELMRTHEELAQAEKMAVLGEMAAELAHEIRNPLAGIRHAVEFLSSRHGDSSSRNEMSKLSLTGLDRIERMISSTLTLVKQGTRNPERLSVTKVSLTDLIRQAASEMGLNRQVTVTTNGGNSHSAFVDRDATIQILSNLFRNAADVSKGEAILVTIQHESGNIHVCIQDKGPGISEVARDRIFEPFFTTRPGGLGLGLAIARHLARSQNGDLKVGDSDTGGCFVLTLPEASA